jgi:putative NIF3 family GTP cyclohydrolase 1 type 2
MTARQIADAFERIAPLSSGLPGDELGFVHGDPATPVQGVACMWNAHSGSIRRAADLGLNMLIVHEQLLYHPQSSPWYDGPRAAGDIVANRQRTELLEKHRMVVYRSHSNWDALPGDGVPDQSVRALGIPGLSVVASQKFFRVHRLPQAMSVRDLAEVARRGHDVPLVHVFGDPDRSVRQMAVLIGGFGGNQIHMPQAAVELGAEVVILGEMIEFIVIAALECGVPVIVTLHSRSEIPAIRRQAELLQAALPQARVQYVDSGALGFDGPAESSQ